MSDTRDKKIDIENRLSAAMLSEIAKNPQLQKTLYALADSLRKKVLGPLIDAIKAPGGSYIGNIDNTPLEIRKAIDRLAVQHSSQARQFDAVQPHYATGTDILSSMERVNKLLTELDDILSGKIAILNSDDAVKLVKIMVDLSECYVFNL